MSENEPFLSRVIAARRAAWQVFLVAVGADLCQIPGSGPGCGVEQLLG